MKTQEFVPVPRHSDITISCQPSHNYVIAYIGPFAARRYLASTPRWAEFSYEPKFRRILMRPRNDKTDRAYVISYRKNGSALVYLTAVFEYYNLPFPRDTRIKTNLAEMNGLLAFHLPADRITQ